MKRIAWISGAAVLAVAALLLLFFALLPRDALEARLGQQIAAWTGREVSLRGAPELDLFPRLAVTLNDVQVGGPAGMADAEIVSMDRLRGTIRLLPLIIGRVEIGSFTMVRPFIRLVRDERGERNWAFDSGAAALQLAFAGDVPLGDFVMEDGTIVVENRRRGAAEQIDSVNLKMDWPSVRQPLAFTASGIWRGEAVALSATAGSPFDFLNGDATEVNARLDSAPIAVAFTGAAADIGEPQLRGALTMTTPSLRGFARWLGNPAGPGSTLGPASLAGAATFREGVLSVSDARLALDRNSAAGALEIAAAGKPEVTGTLALDELDLTSYFQGIFPDLGSGRDWRELRLPTDWLADLDADIRLSAGSVRIGRLSFGRTAASASVRDGRLEIGVAESAFSGGTLTGELSLADAVADGGAAMQAKLRAADFDIEQAAVPLDLPSGLSGTATVAVDLASAGATLGALVRGFAGTGRIDVRDGSLPLFGIAEVAATGDEDVGAEPFGLVPVDRAFAGLSFAGGTALVEQSTVAASGFDADVKGWITLADGGLGLNGTAQPKEKGAPTSPPVPFTIEGTLSHPLARPLTLPN